MSLRTILLGMSEVGAGPCKVRDEGSCPDQNSQNPSCHECSFAGDDHTEFASAHRGRTRRYNEIGTISTVGKVNDTEYYVFSHKGDGKEQSRVSISKQKI